MSGPGALPVLMYHSVGRLIPEWRWSELTVPAAVFEDHLKWLKKRGVMELRLTISTVMKINVFLGLVKAK